MKTEAEISAAARDERPFSNGTEGYAWMDRWCYECVHNDEETSKFCPILTVAYLGKTPAEWIELDRMSLGGQYECTEFEQRDEGGGGDGEPDPGPRWDPEMPGQTTIFDFFVDEFVDSLAVPERVRT